jgi:hypothetical protein
MIRALIVISLAFGPAVVSGVAGAQEPRLPTSTPPIAETPRPEPIRLEPPPPGFHRVTGEPTPTATPTPLVEPKLVAALESREGPDTERVAFFSDGTLVLVQGYRGRRTLRRKKLTIPEVDLYRKVCSEVLLVPPASVPERGSTEVRGRRIRIEVVDPEGRSRIFETDDLTGLPLPVGRAKAALEDLRSRFFRTDPKESHWDPKGVRTGDYLRYRSDGSWYVVVRDDAFEPSLEVEQTGGLRNRLLLSRDQIPDLFENPAEAGIPPFPTPRH